MILPALCFILLILAFNIGRRDEEPGVLASILPAAIACGALATVFTEALSAARLLTPGWVAAAWVMADLILAAVLLFLWWRSRMTEKHRRPARAPLSRAERFLLAGVGFYVAALAAIALIAPPNNWDSMTYHMSRVAHWVQNQSVAFYPTHVLRQLHLAPWAEYAILHLQILSGGDRFANLVQWLSMVVCLAGVSLLAKRLGGTPFAQVFSAAVCVTIPMGILQATSTQNDYAVSMWLVCLVYFIMRLREKASWFDATMAGGSLGLAVLTKGTAYVYALPFLVWWGFGVLKAKSLERWGQALLAGIIALFLNLPFYARNLSLYHKPLGPGQESPTGFKYVNDAFTVSGSFSNLIRNLSLHTGTIPRINASLERAAYALLGGAANDPRTTWDGATFHVRPISNYEDSAGNPVHLLLVIASLASVAFFRKVRESRETIVLSVLLLCGFLLFCVLLKWQPDHCRLHLPLFVLWSPVIGASHSAILKPRMARFLAAFVVVAGLPWLLTNKLKPTVNVTGRSRYFIDSRNIFNKSRLEQRFVNSPWLMAPYVGAADFIRKEQASDVGLILGVNDSEYQLWTLLKPHGEKTPRIEHVCVSNISNTLRSEPFHPSLILAVGDEASSRTRIQCEGERYSREWSQGSVSVFVGRRGSGSPARGSAGRG